MYDEIVSDCIEHLPDAPRATVLDRAYRSVIDLCKAANVLVQDVDINVLAGATSLTVVSNDPALFKPLRLVKVVSPEHYKANRDYSQLPTRTVTLYRIPKENTTFSVKVAVHPIYKANTDFPEELDRYRDAIYHGILYQCMIQPGQRYTNPKLADYHRTMAEARYQEARRHADLAHHNANKIARMRRFI